MSTLPAGLTPADLPQIGGVPLTSFILAAVAAGAMLLVVLGITSKAPEVDEVTRRLERYADPDMMSASATSHGTSPRQLLDNITDGLQRLMGRSERTSQLAEQLAKADIRLKTSEWALGVAGAGVLLGLLLVWRFGSPFAFPIGPVVAYFGSGIVLRVKQGRRLRAFDKQLGDTIVLLSNALKAGYSFAQAIATVAKTANPPIAEEFTRATREMALGISVDDALNHMTKRNNSEDFDLMVTAVQIHRVVGGNLAEILDTIAHTIRERVRIKGEIRTLTAQARASGWIITILPLALCGILSVISPDYFNPMFKETLGRIMLMMGGFSMAVGFAIIQKITKIEV